MELKWSKEQQAVFSSTGNTLVSASAGSGKTTVMIEKILRLVEEGQDIRRVLVMTFSRASAQDMRIKLVEKMHKRLSFGVHSELIRKQLENIPFSNICTINSFCYTLMKRYFSVVGVDPSCSILDDKEQKSLLSECLDRVLEREMEKGDEKFFRTLEFFSKRRNLDELKEVVLSLRSFLAVQEDPEAFLKNAEKDNMPALENYYLIRMREKAGKLASDCRALLRRKAEEGCSLSDEKYRDLLLRLEELQSGSITAFFTGIQNFDPPRAFPSSYVEKGKISAELQEAYLSFLSSVRSFIKDGEEGSLLYSRQSSSTDVTDILIMLYRANEKEYSLRKKQRSVVDFNDAERAALTILQQPDCREDIRRKFDYIFIDEYQDTNYLQEALLRGVSRGDNLFAVGDVKQAIYRFRYAEPEIFNRRKKRYEEDAGEGNNRFLNDNYRSCDRILDFTNEVCAEVMTESFGGVEYRTDAMLRGGKQERGEEDAVKIFTYSEEKEQKVWQKGAVYRVSTAEKEKQEDKEAEFIAAETAKLIEAKYKPEDIAILFRKGDKTEGVASALKKKGIPYYIARDKKTILPERETIIDCLRLLLNDKEDIPLVNVLSSDMFGFGEDELMKIRLSMPGVSFSEAFSQYVGEEKTTEKKEKFFCRMDEWRFASTYMTISELMREILRGGYDAVLLKKKECIEQINAFILFVEQQAEKMSLGEFIRYYDDVYDGNMPPAPPAAVTLMTLHGSKGLEFPVVFLPYVSEPFGKRGGLGSLVCDRELGMAVRHFEEDGFQSQKTFALYVMGLKREIEEKEGEARLMYVAFTRAKEKLIVTGKEKEFDGEGEDASCVMDWLMLARRRNGAFSRYFAPITMTEEDSFVAPPARPKGLDFGSLEKEYPFIEGTKTYAKTSVSGILQKEEERGVRIIRKEENQNADRGNAMHAALRYIDFSVRNVDDVRFEIKRLVKEGLLTEREEKLVDCDKLYRAITAPEMGPARSNVCHKEYPFIAYLYPHEGASDKILVQGVIDLLVELPDGSYMLVDYKMSSLGADKLKERYTEQLNLYKMAVESILKKPVKECFLYNLERGYCVRL